MGQFDRDRRYNLALFLRNAAREHLELSNGDYWPFSAAEAMADALLKDYVIESKSGVAGAFSSQDIHRMLPNRWWQSKKMWRCDCGFKSKGYKEFLDHVRKV